MLVSELQISWKKVILTRGENIMFKPRLSERIIHKLDMLTMGPFSPFKRRRLNNTDFTIISNNCWGVLRTNILE